MMNAARQHVSALPPWAAYLLDKMIQETEREQKAERALEDLIRRLR